MHDLGRRLSQIPKEKPPPLSQRGLMPTFEYVLVDVLFKQNFADLGLTQFLRSHWQVTNALAE
jgi:hypothetical protein